MRTYAQPNEYHFAQDSIELVKWAKQYVDCKDPLKVLDVGAGCGVIGIEWFFRRGRIDHVTLCEKQEIFMTALNENINDYKDSLVLLNEDFLLYKLKNKYDIIITNPPFFIKERSRSGTSNIKNICRQISQIDINKWFKKISLALKDNGQVFFVFRLEEEKWINEALESFYIKNKNVKSNYTFYHLILKTNSTIKKV